MRCWRAETFGTTFNNQPGGVFDIRTDLGLDLSSPGTFNNAGTFRKSVTTGTSTVTIAFNNTGTVDLQTGTLSYGGNFTQTAGATVLSGGNLTKTGSAFALQSGDLRGTGTLTGSVSNTGGTVRPGLSPGCLNITGLYTQGAAGTLAIEVGGRPESQGMRIAVVLPDSGERYVSTPFFAT